MTKTLKQIQAENRKFILEAIHGCSYEEALEKEQGATCHYLYQTEFGVKRIMGDIKNYGYNKERHHPNAFLIEIIGQPLTLNRVLLAVIKSGKWMDCSGDKNNKYCNSGWHLNTKENLSEIRNFVLDNWDLKSEALEQQNEEKQIEINKILKRYAKYSIK